MQASIKWSFLLFAVFFLAGLTNSYGSDDPVQKIIQFSANSLESKPSCDSFAQSVQVLDTSAREYYLSKKVALKVLNLASHFPGTPKATENALNTLLYIDETSLPGGPIAGDLRVALTKLEDCRSVEYYGVLTRLLMSRKRYHFTTPEDASLRSLIVNYLQHESAGPRFLFQTRMMIRLLVTSVKEMLLYPSADQRRKIDKLEKLLEQSETSEGSHLEKLETAMALLPAANNPNELNVNRPELLQILWQNQESKRLRLPLQDLVQTFNLQ